MDLLQLLNATGQQDQMLKAVAGQFGLDDQEANLVVNGIMGALSGGVQNQVQQGGLKDVAELANNKQSQEYVEQAQTIANARDNGNNILGQLLGSKDVSRQIASALSKQSGVSPDLIQLMLPNVATMAMGYLGKIAQQDGGADALATTLDAVLDKDGDGRALDDIIEMIAKNQA